MRKLTLGGLTTVALCLLLAAPAFAAKTGEGLAGETTDKVVTFVGFAVMLFFVLFVTLGSIAQHRLEIRKETREAHRARQRVGW